MPATTRRVPWVLLPILTGDPRRRDGIVYDTPTCSAHTPNAEEAFMLNKHAIDNFPC
ncbi:hypothetical protein BD779DRAFT_1552708 [Infundibulicybe gibba]|nr:hypothetical protein BD779DRAFT_1592863 [Infundibulicybe gibba]KAF8879153.1 hypothetical protein BD779DRAFT_1552708 [Infundibulicybe gibba]